MNSLAARLRSSAAFLAIAGALLLGACRAVAPARFDSRHNETEVRQVLERQLGEWNAGNLAGFMETYARSATTRLASGGEVSLGWQTVFDRYQARYTNRVAMGTLAFSNVEVTMLAPDAALVFGRWHLKRAQDQPAGLFTLIVQKLPEGWRIVHDHTSAAPVRSPE